MAAAFAALFLTAAFADAMITCRWHPQNTQDAKGTHEGILIFFEGLTDQATVTIEGESDGKTLPVVSGIPDKYGFIAVPIRNLDTYKLRKLTIVSGSHSWELVDPKQEFELVLPEGR